MISDANVRKLGWGLIGCGDIARKRVAAALRDLHNCNLVAVSRANARLAESFAREFGAAQWYETWQQLISDPEIEAVYIATPVHLHAIQTIAAANAGKHVLCEKPMALNLEECDRMIAACETNNVKLGTAYYRHFYPVITRTKQILESGEIGTPIVAQLNAFERFDPEPSHPRHWLIEKQRSGGGPMFDFGCHRIEVLLNLFGRVEETRSIASNLLFSREVEDTTSAVFRFESGLHGMLSVSHAVRYAEDSFDIYGSEGSIHIRALNEGTITIKTQHGERAETYPPHQNLHQPLIDDFTEAVLNGREPQVDGRIGRSVAQVESAIYGDDLSRELKLGILR